MKPYSLVVCGPADWKERSFTKYGSERNRRAHNGGDMLKREKMGVEGAKLRGKDHITRDRVSR